LPQLRSATFPTDTALFGFVERRVSQDGHSLVEIVPAGTGPSDHVGREDGAVTGRRRNAGSEWDPT
jgi:hypothetical protein